MTSKTDHANENRDIVKKARLTPSEAETLERLAGTLDITQSEAIRRGIRALLRMEQRAENIDQLIDLIDGDEPDKLRFEPAA